MAPLKIAQLGQPALREVATDVPVEVIRTPEFQEFLQAMRDTLAEAGGVGLAAPQVFVSQRVFLAATTLPKEDQPPTLEVMINPRVNFLGEEMIEAWEGCLSFQELLVRVPRFRTLRVDYLDERGEAKTLELAGFPARVVQHEFDHLEGILTLDRAVSTRDIIKASEIDDVLERNEEAGEP